MACNILMYSSSWLKFRKQEEAIKCFMSWHIQLQVGQERDGPIVQLMIASVHCPRFVHKKTTTVLDPRYAQKTIVTVIGQEHVLTPIVIVADPR